MASDPSNCREVGKRMSSGITSVIVMGIAPFTVLRRSTRTEHTDYAHRVSAPFVCSVVIGANRN